MRLLLISSKPCLPSLDGGCMASLRLLENAISSGFEVSHFTYSSEKHTFDINQFTNHFGENFRVKTQVVDLKMNPIQAVLNLLRNKSYNLSRFSSLPFLKSVKEEIDQFEPEIILFDSLFSAAMISEIGKLTNAKLVIRTHNVEHKIWEYNSSNSKNGFKSLYLSILAKQLKREEIEILKHTDTILTISDEDTKVFEALTTKNVRTFHYLPSSTSGQVKTTKNKIQFFGSMNWAPNLMAVDELKNDIFPMLQSRMSLVELHLAGSFQPNKKSSHSSIINHGFVEDIDRFIKENGILVAPIRSGSGVKIKIIEALAKGIIVVTTKLGAIGIEADEKSGLFVRETSSEMVDLIATILSDTSMQEELSKAAKLNFKARFKTQNLYKEIG